MMLCFWVSIQLSDPVSGNEFLDTVTIGSAAIKSQSLGAAILSDGFQGVDGIVGCAHIMTHLFGCAKICCQYRACRLDGRYTLS